jgi:RNA polymerase sigma-70 factor (ECF subfamily)
MQLGRNLTDAQLVEKYKDGDTHALSVLISRYKDQLYTALVLLVKDKELAEDIFQDVFVRVINSLKNNRYRHEGFFFAWIIRIAHNLYLDHLRKAKRRPAISSFDSMDNLDGVDDPSEKDTRLLEENRLQKIREVIWRLPPDQQEIIILRHYAGLSFKEIASVMQISINTALGRMRYALTNLRKIMTEPQRCER